MKKQRMRFHDETTTASNPVAVEVSDARLRAPCPHLHGAFRLHVDNRKVRAVNIEHMQFGDRRAAVVVSVEPLIVAAYTDELDCVALLRFDREFPHEPLEVGSRLLTVNTYGEGDLHQPDLFPGQRASGRWASFHPIIADFVCSDPAPVERRKAAIDDDEWERTLRFGNWQLGLDPAVARDGAPDRSMVPARKWTD